MLILNVRVPGEPLRRIRLEKPSATLGRSSQSDIPLADRTLSRVHARIETTETAAVLTDLGSRNGTSLNGKRITEPVSLHAGDRILLGETAIDVSEESTTRVVIEARERESPSETTLFRSSSDLVKQQQSWDPKMGAEELARLNASLRILNEVSMELMGDLPLGRLLGIVVEKLFAYLKPDRGLLMLADEAGELKPEVVRIAPGVDPADIRLSKAIVQQVVERRNGVLLIDTESDAELGTADSIRLHGITSCMAAPLFVDEKVIGLVYLEARLGRKSFTEDDLRLLTSVANTAAMKIENLRLQEESAAKQRIEREMALAWDIQKRLLPERAPEVPMTELLGRTIPSRTVSGDYYDFFVRPDNAVDVVVADVSGKGMGASILAASVQAAFQVWAAEFYPPDRLCSRLNDLVFRRTSPEKFITAFAALYDPETGGVIFTNAGHNPGLLVRAGGTVERLAAHGPPLGLFAGRAYGSGSITLGPGDLLVLYSDGFTEASNADEEEFGLDRLVDAVLPSRGKPLPDVEADITAALAGFVGPTPYADDRTLVLLRRTD